MRRDRGNEGHPGCGGRNEIGGDLVPKFLPFSPRLRIRDRSVGVVTLLGGGAGPSLLSGVGDARRTSSFRVPFPWVGHGPWVSVVRNRLPYTIFTVVFYPSLGRPVVPSHLSTSASPCLKGRALRPVTTPFSHPIPLCLEWPKTETSGP